MQSKVQSMAIFIEFIAGSGLAIFFHFVLHHPEAAYLIFGVGILLSLATYLLREDIELTRAALMEQYDHAHDLTFTMAQITDPECRDKAQEILASTQRTFALLRQGYVPLDETEFYMKGTKYFGEARQRVRAVDPLTVHWDSRGALVNYYQANLRALERGVTITRIFVIPREELGAPEVQKVLMQQKRDGVEVRVAFREELPTATAIGGRDTTGAFDFAIYDEKVATEVFGQPGKYFGRKTRDPALVESYLHLFSLIEHGSHALSADEETVPTPSVPLPLET
ncbi:hypothetical protein [Geomesophilobacter sediminis]|uniref:Uncharacterized protein n=1 Tax=Geomesophilobacter sediminis TaxID=2798584 RepID=A0A8J7LZF8_9BACT|nr:hypothetical protein [Geomesophilobacter sediminis]MBJ6726346.1 hypothetical protein [Geomesophilobacter sediminis]